MGLKLAEISFLCIAWVKEQFGRQGERIIEFAELLPPNPIAQQQIGTAVVVLVAPDRREVYIVLPWSRQ